MKQKARFLLAGLALLIVTSSLSAQGYDIRVWGPLDGVPVRQGSHIEWFRSVASDADGNMGMIWSDARSGGRDMYMQVTDADGTELWSDSEGKLVAGGINRQEDPHLMATSDGNWIITWIDYRDSGPNEDTGDVYITKLDSDGNQLWAATSPDSGTGIPIARVPAKQLWVQSFSDGNGGCVSIWVDGRNQNADIYGQHMDADGNKQWLTGHPGNEWGIVLAGGISDQGSVGGAKYTADTDGAGGMIYGWQDNRDPVNLNLYCNRVDINGDLLWADETGLAMCLVDGEQDAFRMAPDGNGGAFFVWEDSRTLGDINLYGNHLDADGNMSWTPGGVVICDAASTQGAPRIISTVPGEAIMMWDDSRVDEFHSDIYTQRISDDNGSLMTHWGHNGMVLADEVNNQQGGRLTHDGAGGAVYTWKDERYGQAPNNDLFAQRINQDGDWQWGPDMNGTPVSLAANTQDGNIVRRMAGNSFGVVWQDFREGSPGLYFQNFASSGTPSLQEDGEKIMFGIDANAIWPRILSSTIESEYYLTWTDGRYGILGNYPYVQLLRAPLHAREKEFVFEENGISLLPGYPIGDTISVAIEDLDQAVSPDAGLLSVWVDGRQGSAPLLYAQKMDSQGNVLWGDIGVSVAVDPQIEVPDSQEKPRILPTDDGGAFVFYNQTNFDLYLQIHAQRLNSSGVGLWNNEPDYGIALTAQDEDHEIMDVHYFDNGTILVVYKYSDVGGRDLFAMAIDEDGEFVWDDPVSICSAEGMQNEGKTITVDGGIVIVWEDARRGISIRDLYGQIIDEDGNLGWTTNGVMLVEDDNRQNEVCLNSTGSDAQWFWMTWKSAADGITNDILTQRFDLDGAPLLLPSTGIGIGDEASPQQTPATVMDADDGLFIMWVENVDNQDFSDLLYTEIDINGDPVGGFQLDQGEILSDAYHIQADVTAVSDGDVGFVALWRDNRSTGKEELKNVYVQRCNLPLDVGEKSATLPINMELANNYPNPFNPSTMIGFTIDRPAPVRLVIYDVLGREVIRLVNRALNAGQYEVMWDGKSSFGQEVASGMYFYRLEVNDELVTRSMVLLK